MSSSTAAAARWFVPNSEWAALNADYAIVHESALSVRRTVQEYNEALPSRSYSSYRDFLDEIKYLPSPYHIITEGTLVFADVDQHDPSHKEQVLAWAKEPLLETKTAETTAAETALLSALGGKTDAEHLVKLVKVEAPDGLRDVFVNYILNADDQTHRQESPSPLPTGWLCAYDLLAHALLIKPFLSNPSHHPSPTPGPAPPADGVSFRGSPASFLESYCPAPDAPPPPATAPAQRRLPHGHVRPRRQVAAAPLAGAAHRPPALADAHKGALVDALQRTKAALARRPFPAAAGGEERLGGRGRGVGRWRGGR
ncbi:MAG: hypothetical protein FRX48_05443 [Lasallia pustulata]|uniref:Uncharacterized protein n=1 Tax=Lasallia pustulata TaxID=136370 RepID=A0A5M8PNM6_9LECA|nr:MAG: hypothetical protein FRX48_05443 [Lasallia pustulata]